MLLIPAEIRPSPIEGNGLFTLAPLSRGELVWRFDARFDQEFADADVLALPPAAMDFMRRYAYRARATGRWTLNVDLSRHMNHAEQPSLVADADSNYYAARDLPAGTELTCDYREFAAEGSIDGIAVFAPPPASAPSAAA